MGHFPSRYKQPRVMSNFLTVNVKGLAIQQLQIGFSLSSPLESSHMTRRQFSCWKQCYTTCHSCVCLEVCCCCCLPQRKNFFFGFGSQSKADAVGFFFWHTASNYSNTNYSPTHGGDRHIWKFWILLSKKKKINIFMLTNEKKANIVNCISSNCSS